MLSYKQMNSAPHLHQIQIYHLWQCRVEIEGNSVTYFDYIAAQQSHAEIEGYSVAYFDRIAVFEVPCR